MDNEKRGTQGEHRHHRGTVGDELIWHLGVAARNAAIKGAQAQGQQNKKDLEMVEI